MFFSFRIHRFFPNRHAKSVFIAASAALMLLPVGCTATGTSHSAAKLALAASPAASPAASMASFLTAEQLGAAPSQKAELVFGQLMLDQGLRSSDRAAILQGADRLLSHSGKGKGQSPSASIADAAIWLLSHDFPDDAAALVERASAVLPEDLPLTAMRADILIQQEQSDKAIVLMQDFAGRHPNDHSAQAELAVVFLKSGKNAEALTVFQSIPDAKLTPPMRFTYAQALNVNRRFDEAEKQLRAAVKDAPEYAEAWQLLGLTLEEAGRGKEALAVYGKLLDADPGNRSARLFLLRFHLRGGDIKAALDVVKEAADPLHFAVAASSLLVEEKRFKDAESLLMALEAVPGFPEGVYFYHAALLYEAGSSVEEAVRLLDKVTESSDEYDKALRLKVRLLCDLERFPQALEAVTTVHRLNPEDAEPMLLMGELCSRLKRYDEAEAIFAKALREHPDDGHLHFRNAYLRELQGKREQAMMLMEKVILQFPDHALALNYVGYNLADKGVDLERALALIQRAVELEPEADFIIDSLAWAHYRLGNLDEAWTQIQRAVALGKNGPEDPSMLEHFGDIAFARGDRASALRGWQASEEIFLKLNLRDDARRVRNKREDCR